MPAARRDARVARAAPQVGRPLRELKADLVSKLTAIHARFGKPIMVSECGADTLPGCHMMAPGLWSEEYQSQLMHLYASLHAPDERPWLFGVHIWNLTDFRTPQMYLRAAGCNHKGVFTRLREPKMAAHKLRERWAPGASGDEV